MSHRFTPAPRIRRLLLGATSIAALGLAMPAHAADWTGATSSDWFSAGNWSTGVPNSGNNVFINTVTPNATVVGAAGAQVASLRIGDTGTGTLTIENGGTVSNTTIGIIGYDPGSTGTVTVTGAGSSWTNSVDLYVGWSGTGTLSVQNGGAVSNDIGFIGSDSGSTGTVMVTGAGSSWTNFDNLYVGRSGTGTLSVQNGGAVSNDIGIIGSNSGSTGTVTVEGAGSSWTNSDDLYVGDSGTGTLSVQNGGTVSNTSGAIGSGASSTGTVTVTGAGSSWTNSGLLDVGVSGTGTLSVQNGGAVSDDIGFIGFNSGSTGTVTITGAGSTWSNSGNLIVGYFGTGTLSVQNGGAVSNDIGVVSGSVGSTGTVTVDGAGSSWTNSGDLNVGYIGTGTLSVQNGAAVSNASGFIGLYASSTGTVTVDGTGSSWTNSGGLYIGVSGTGALTIQNGGTVNVAGAVVVADSSTGVLNIGAASGEAAVAPGTLNAASITFGAGTGSIVFNHTASNYIFAPAISGAGSVTVEAGFTSLTGDSSGFAGSTTVAGGTLSVNGTLGGSLDVLAAGRLQGIGTVGGTTVAGTIAPGNSIGALSVAGNITFNAGSTYEVEVNAAGQADRIDATGTATIDGGAVEVQNATGVYALGSSYTILTAAGGVTGTFASLTQATPLSTPFLSFGLSYDANAAYLNVGRSDVTFASVGQTANQTATGLGLDGAPLSSPLVAAMAQLDAASAGSALDQLSGEVHASAKMALIEDSRFVRNAVNDRLRAAFAGVGALGGTVVAYEDGKPRAVAATTDRFAVWGQGFGAWGHSGGDGNAASLNRSTGGVFIGADGPVFDRWRFGAVAGYSRTDFNVRSRGSSGASDNYYVGLYGGTSRTVLGGALAFRTGTAYTWHDISTSRSVAFSGFADSLKGDYAAGTGQVFGELGYGIRAGDVAFEPFANIAYVSLYGDGFTETGGAATLTGASATTDVTFTTLGLRASTTFDLSGISATARGMLGWRHAFGDVTPLAAMRFDGGDAFSIGGVPIASDAALIEAGLDLDLSPSARLGLSYGAQFSSGLSDQSIKANFNLKF